MKQNRGQRLTQYLTKTRGKHEGLNTQDKGHLRTMNRRLTNDKTHGRIT